MPEDTPTQDQNKPLSVSQAMAIAKGSLEGITLTLVGEVSEMSKRGYKAMYFTVKDDGAALPAMMWTNRFEASGVDLRVGMLVQLTGRFTLYAPKGRMNFDVFKLSVAGEGDLREKVANLARKLRDEGLMEQSRKRPIPPFPQKVGLVTSPRGAVVHDVLRTFRRRFPAATILFAGVPVEGASAPASLAEGIKKVTDAGAEVVLLVRGGGSFEDLMPFNDEMLARSIAGNQVPVVTGIGHEPDTSIADMVADKRASTPTAAAEAVAPDSLELMAHLTQTQLSVTRVLLGRLERSATVLDNIASRPIFADPYGLFASEAQSLDMAYERLMRSIPNNVAQDASTLDAARIRLAGIGDRLLKQENVELSGVGRRLSVRGSSLLETYESALRLASGRLDDLSPLAVLNRGYSLARNERGEVVKSVHTVAAGDTVNITVSDGDIACIVKDTALSNNEYIAWKDSE